MLTKDSLQYLPPEYRDLVIQTTPTYAYMEFVRFELEIQNQRFQGLTLNMEDEELLKLTREIQSRIVALKSLLVFFEYLDQEQRNG